MFRRRNTKEYEVPLTKEKFQALARLIAGWDEKLDTLEREQAMLLACFHIESIFGIKVPASWID